MKTLLSLMGRGGSLNDLLLSSSHVSTREYFRLLLYKDFMTLAVNFTRCDFHKYKYFKVFLKLSNSNASVGI